MNEIIAFIIIWGIISLLSQLSKKSKQREAKQSPKSVRPTKPKTESEIPPFLRDLLGLPKEAEKVPSSTVRIPEQKMVLEPEESLPETEIHILPVELNAEIIEEEEFPSPETEIKKEKIEIEIEPLETPEQSYQPQVQYLSGMGKLKQAVIWKEILDKPVSLRRRDLFKNPFIKF